MLVKVWVQSFVVGVGFFILEDMVKSSFLKWAVFSLKVRG
jgi:hypothetical protein